MSKTKKELETELSVLKEDRKNLEREIRQAWAQAYKYEAIAIRDFKFIKGIFSFILAQGSQDPQKILANIGHDLAQWNTNRDKDFFCPRTSRYQPIKEDIR